LNLNREGTELRYYIHIRGLSGDVTAVTLQIGEEDSIPLIDDEENPSLRGSVEVTPEQVAALAAGEASISVEAGEEIIGGPVEALFQKFRERMAEFLAGKGALRVDTGRGDVLPVEESIAELVGAIITVESEAEEVVLMGEVGELFEGWRCGHRDKSNDVADNGGADDGTDDGTGAFVEEAFFEVGESHDASFIRGDANDDGHVDMSDAIHVLGHLFLGGPAPYCADAADANDNGLVQLSDPITVLQVLFQGTGSIAEPYPSSGYDRTVDELSCDELAASQ
jgi:hypothetical protein